MRRRIRLDVGTDACAWSRYRRSRGWRVSSPPRVGADFLARARARVYMTGGRTSPADSPRSRLAVRLPPGDHRVPQHADPLDLRLDHVSRLQVQRRSILGE